MDPPVKVSICPLCLIPLNWLFPWWPGTLSACVQAVNIDLSDNFPKQCSLPSFFLNHRHISIVFIRHIFSQSLTQSQPCWNLTYVSFGWRKYLLNTSANFVDGLVFDVKVNLDIDIDFDVDFAVIEVMWDFEDDDIVSLFVFLPTDKSESHSSRRHPRKVQFAKKFFNYLNTFGLKTAQRTLKSTSQE